MKFVFSKKNYNEEEKLWIKKFEDISLKLSFENKINRINNKKEDEFEAFKILFKEFPNSKNFIINEFVLFQLNNIHSTANKNKKENNDNARLHSLKITNNEIFNNSLDKIIYIIKNYPENNNNIIDKLSQEENLKKIHEIAIDKDLNKATILFIDNNVKIDHNKILNLSIRNSNQDIFEKIIINFKGKKENFENLSDSPFFWQPLLFHKNKDFSPKYIYDQLLDNNFKIGKVEILKMIEVSKESPQKLKFYNDLDKRIDNKSTMQRSLKF